MSYQSKTAEFISEWKQGAINQVQEAVDGLHNMTKATNSIEEVGAALDNKVARAIFDNQMRSVLHAGVRSAQEDEMRNTDD